MPKYTCSISEDCDDDAAAHDDDDQCRMMLMGQLNNTVFINSVRGGFIISVPPALKGGTLCGSHFVKMYMSN